MTSFNAEAYHDLVDEDIVALSPQGAPIKGRSAFMEAERAYLKPTSDYEWVHYQAQWKDVQIVADHAYEWGVVESVVRYKSTGSLLAQTWTSLRVLRRQKDGTWRVLRSCYADGPKAQ